MGLYIVKAPRFDPSAEKVTVVEWKKSEGQKVAKGEELVELVGEKTTFAYESPCNGVLRKILVREGEVAVGSPIAELECEE
ncbi:MAG: lipoyl domain-containing protein [Desulfurococcaceae archaeon]